ncbi:hypothetical protein ACFL6C_06115 [Myxococcota bacterium]
MVVGVGRLGGKEHMVVLMLRGSSNLVCAVLVAHASPAVAADHLTVAILPATTSGGTSAAILRAVDGAIEELVASTSAVDALQGRELRKRLRKDPASAGESCSQDPVCLARLGRKARVDEVVTVRARQHDGGLRMTFIVVGVSDRRLRRTISVNVESADEIASGVRLRLARILGVTHAELRGGSAPAPEGIMPELTPMPTLEPVPPEPTIEPRPEPPLAQHPSEAVAAEPSGKSEELAAILPGDARQEEAGTSDALWYGGWCGLSASAILLGISGYFGLQYRSAVDQLDPDCDKCTPLPKAIRLQDEANDARLIGLITVAVAAVAAATGASLLVFSDMSVSVSTTGDRAQASLALSW